MSLVYIYGLADPRAPDAICYIGQTVDPQARLKQHVTEAKQGLRAARAAWVRQLLADGVTPCMSILTTADAGAAHTVEADYIARYLQRGRLVNTLHTARPRPARTTGNASIWLNMKMPASLVDEIKALAAKERRPISQMVALLLEDWLVSQRRPRSPSRTPKEQP